MGIWFRRLADPHSPPSRSAHHWHSAPGVPLKPRISPCATTAHQGSIGAGRELDRSKQRLRAPARLPSPLVGTRPKAHCHLPEGTRPKTHMAISAREPGLEHMAISPRGTRPTAPLRRSATASIRCRSETSCGPETQVPVASIAPHLLPS